MSYAMAWVVPGLGRTFIVATNPCDAVPCPAPFLAWAPQARKIAAGLERSRNVAVSRAFAARERTPNGYLGCLVPAGGKAVSDVGSSLNRGPD